MLPYQSPLAFAFAVSSSSRCSARNLPTERADASSMSWSNGLALEIANLMIPDRHRQLLISTGTASAVEDMSNLCHRFQLLICQFCKSVECHTMTERHSNSLQGSVMHFFLGLHSVFRS